MSREFCTESFSNISVNKTSIVTMIRLKNIRTIYLLFDTTKPCEIISTFFGNIQSKYLCNGQLVSFSGYTLGWLVNPCCRKLIRRILVFPTDSKLYSLYCNYRELTSITISGRELIICHDHHFE